MSMADFRFGPILFNVVIYGLILANTEALFVKTTILTSAVAKGAVCLDGSPPAYNIDKGTGIGINNWLIHFEGGGWCHNVTNCKSRSTTRLGSSKVMGPELPFSGILNNRKEQNPDFYNWNRVKLRYCDGASFTGDVEKVDPATNLHFRGARIWSAVIEELLSLGMKSAQNVLLSGCSAGGLAATLHCDGFKKLLPPAAKLKCLNDGGYFVNVKDISKGSYVENYLAEIVTLHGSAENLPVSCTSKMKPTLCFFPQNVAPQIQQPFFVLNSAVDSWQIKNILAPAVVDTGGAWSKCKLDYTACTPAQLQTMQDFRKQFLEVLPPAANPSTRGLFIDSCYAHCQTEMQGLWFMPQSPALNGTKIATAVGDWFYERSPVSKIDCPYPCNPTCPVRAPQQQSED